MGLVWSAYGNGTSYAISLRPQPLIITAETGGETAHVMSPGPSLPRR